jgi:hypothetical protein
VTFSQPNKRVGYRSAAKNGKADEIAKDAAFIRSRLATGQTPCPDRK